MGQYAPREMTENGEKFADFLDSTMTAICFLLARPSMEVPYNIVS
jgi:hypothetical protein